MSQQTVPVPAPALVATATPSRSVLRSRDLLAAAVVVAPALIAINSLFHPAVEMTGASILAAAASGPSAWFGVHVVAALGAVLGVPAAFGLRRLVQDRGRRLATAGLGLTVVGSPLLAMTFTAEASVLRLAAGLERDAALALAEAYARAPEFYAVGAAVALTTLGGLLLGVAMLVGRSVPRWLAGTFVLATAATVVSAPGTVTGPVAFGVIAIVSIGLATRIRQGDHAAPPGA